jgi:hypothetical protein
MPHKFPSIIGVMYGIPEYKQDVTQPPTPHQTHHQKNAMREIVRVEFVNE